MWLFAVTVLIILWCFAYSRAAWMRAYDSQWHLIQPPFSLTGEHFENAWPDVAAPVWEWDIYETYKSEEQCGYALRKNQAENHRALDPGKFSNVVVDVAINDVSRLQTLTAHITTNGLTRTKRLLLNRRNP